jgi:hypothetical protein
MTPVARTLANVLLAHHRQRCLPLAHITNQVTDDVIKASTIEYGQLCQMASVSHLTRIVGDFLFEIAEWCDKNGWPPINSLAVNAVSHIPGEGYDKAPGCDIRHWPAHLGIA